MSPCRSVRLLSQLLNLSDISVRWILHHDLRFHPYKLQIVQELTAAQKRCASVVANRWCTRTLTSNSPDLTAADFFYGGIWKLKFLLTPSLTLTALKMQFVRRLRMLRRTHYVASWQVYLGDGSNALIVMEDISKTLYWRRESKTLTYLTVFSCIYCCVQ